MLTQMRNASKGWLATILVGLLILAFGTWGIQSAFMPSPTDAVARVGDRKIQKREFIREFESALEMQTRQTGQRISPQDASRMGFDKQFLDQMITRTEFEIAADDLGLTVPDKPLRKFITSSEAFKGVTGDFDRERFREVLYRMKLSEGQFVDSMRSDLTRMQLINAIVRGVQLPRGMVEALYKYGSERRSARYLVLTPDVSGRVPEPTEEALSKFHQSHAAKYTAPETRAFTYVLLRPKDVMDQVNIPEQDVAHEYEIHKLEYRKPETRKVRQITYANRDEALAALQELRGGASFERIAAKKGFKPEDIELGDVRKDQFLDPAVGEAAYALKQPGLTGVVKGQFGFVIAQVVSITPASTQSLESVRESLHDRLALEAAAGRIEDIRAEFEDALAAQSGTLEDLAKRLGLKAVKVAPVDQTGHSADGQRPETLPKDTEILRAAFVNEEDEDLGLEQLPKDGYFVVRVDEVHPSALRPLEKIRDRVTADWKADQVRQRLEKLAGEVAERTGKGEKLADIAAQFNLAVVTTRPPVSRNGAGTDVFSPQVVKDLFAAKPGEMVRGPVRNGDSYVVAVLDKIQPPDLSSAQARAALNQQMNRFNQEYGLTLADQYERQLRTELGVKQFSDVLAQAVSEAR